MATISVQELARLVPCSVDRVERLRQAGLLAPENGQHDSADVHVVRLMSAFEDAGISLEDVARGVAEGELSFPMGLFMPPPMERSVTYAALAARLQCRPGFLRRLSTELGFAPAADDHLRAEDAEILSRIIMTLDLADEDELSRYARLYGGTIQRLVAAGLQFFDVVVRQKVAAFDLPNEEKDRIVYQHGAGFGGLASEIVPWLQRRHRERGVLEYLVGVTETFMEERGITPEQSRQLPAIAFLDLTGYTALAEERGDAAAAELATGLASIVQETSQPHGGRPVKWLGDGVMFHFPNPGNAILGGLDLVEQTEEALSVAARIGINAGTLIAQEGDFFGRTVNVAARIVEHAQPREVLVSEAAKERSTADHVSFELVGEVLLKGMTKPVRLHRARRAAKSLGR
ncbi:MAG: adenylate/guanylate cyclase domain-containing protein [Acidimicrobiia bacterium]